MHSELEWLTASVEELTRRVLEIEDKLAIRELTARYNRAFDEVHAEAYAETFTSDGALQLGEDGEPTEGRHALASFNREIGFGLVHSTVDPLIDVVGDRATQTCNLILTTRTEVGNRGTVTLSNTGRYRDELVRTSEGWRFSRRVWFPDQANVQEDP